MTGITVARFRSELLSLLEKAREAAEAVREEDLAHWAITRVDLCAIDYLRQEFHGEDEARQRVALDEA